MFDSENKPRSIDILMSDVVGIKKRDRTSLLVVVAAGLEIECIDGRVRASRTSPVVDRS